MKESWIWLSYDLGIRGNYSGLYAWLDGHEAIDCGDSLAYLKFTYENNLRDELHEQLVGIVGNDSGARVYVIYFDNVKQKRLGAFLIGGRKAPPWTGFAIKGQQAPDEGD